MDIDQALTQPRDVYDCMSVLCIQLPQSKPSSEGWAACILQQQTTDYI